MTTRARLRSRHRKHKRRTYWRKLRRERGYFECGEPLTGSEVLARMWEDAAPTYLEVPPSVVGLGAEIEEVRRSIGQTLGADLLSDLAKPFLDRMQPPGGPWIKLF